MNERMRLNHVAQRVETGKYEIVVDLFKERLGFSELRRTERAIWLRQEGANVDIQLTRSTEVSRDQDKRGSQISFLSDSPRESLEDLAGWLDGKGVETKIGWWSDKEFYLDAPEVFVDFVIEAMTPDMAKY